MLSYIIPVNLYLSIQIYLDLGTFLIIDQINKRVYWNKGIVTHNLDKGFTIIESEIEPLSKY